MACQGCADRRKALTALGAALRSANLHAAKERAGFVASSSASDLKAGAKGLAEKARVAAAKVRMGR